MERQGNGRNYCVEAPPPTARPSDTPAHAVSSCGVQRKGTSDLLPALLRCRGATGLVGRGSGSPFGRSNRSRRGPGIAKLPTPESEVTMVGAEEVARRVPER